MIVTNKMLAQYLANKELVAQLLRDNSILEAAIKLKGGVNTRDYTAVVKENERQYVVGRKEFETKFGPEFLVKNDLLKTSTYQQVIIVEKKKA